MEHKQFTSGGLNGSPVQGFQTDRFFKKTSQLNIPDTILEHCSGELSGDSINMEAVKAMTESFYSDDKENLSNQQVVYNKSLNDSIKIEFDESHIKQCERKLLESSSSDDERNETEDKSTVKNHFLNIQRKFDETISTPPSLLRKEISMLRTEMAEADEFHDLEMQLLKDEKLQNEEEDFGNYTKVELLKKNSELMELYTALKTEYEEYRKAQEKVSRELEFKTADCLESLCSQIEASDNSLNFSCASFVSFSGGIKSSTMVEDATEVEATVLHDATVLANDPLSLTTSEGLLKTPMPTPLRPMKEMFPHNLDSTLKKPVVIDLKEKMSKLESTIPLESEYGIQCLNLEAALYDKTKEVKDLEQRLFKVEEMSGILQTEFDRICSVYKKENEGLKESLTEKTEQLNELTEKLFTEIISLNPSLRDSLLDASGKKLLLVFIETIMENCKKINGQDALATIESLQNQLTVQEIKLAELEDLKKKLEDVQEKLSKAESTILTRDEEIQLLQSHVSNVRQTREDLASANLALSELESRLTLAEAEKMAAHQKCVELETAIAKLNQEFESDEKLRTELQARLTSAEEEKSEMRKENAHLKELCDSLQAQLLETEKIIKSNELELIKSEESLTAADERVQQLKSQLKLTEEEKSELEKRCTELQKISENLQVELTETKNNPEYEKIQNENTDLSQRLSESEKIIAELKIELELAKQCQEENSSKFQELISEIEGLKEEKSGFSKALDKVEESQKNLADALCDFGDDNDLPTERIIKLMANTSKPQEETRETKIICAFVETITKTCKGVQNELIKKFNTKELEWESQRHSDLSLMEKLEEEIKSLTEKSSQHEARIAEMSVEKEELTNLHESLKQQMAEAEKIISACKEEIGQLKSHEAALKQAKEELAAADEAIAELKSQLSSTEGEKVEIEIRCRELEENKRNLQTEISTKETAVREIEELKSVKERMEKENETLKKQISESEEMICLLKKTLEEAEEEQNARELRIKAAADEAIAELKSQLSSIETEKVEVELRCRELEENKISLQTEINSKETIVREIEELKSVKDRMEKENGTLKEQMSESEETICRLKKTLEEAEEQQNERELKLKEFESDIDLLTKGKEDLTGKLENLEKNNKNLSDVITEVQTHLRMPEDTLDKILSGSLGSKIFSEKINNLIKSQMEENELSVLEEKERLLNELRNACGELETKLSKSEKTVSEKEEEIVRLQSEVQQARGDFAAAKTNLTELETWKSATENRHRELEEAVDKLKSEIETNEKIRNELLAQLSVAEENKTEMESLKESYKALKEEKTELEDAISQRNEEIRVLKSTGLEQEEKMENLKAMCENLESELSEAKMAMLAKEEEIQKVQSDLKQTQEDLAATKTALSELETRLEQAESEKTDAVNRCHELEKTMEDLKEEMTTTKKLKEELEKEKSKTEAENDFLKDSLDELKLRMTGIENAVLTRDEELNSVRHEIATAEETIQELKSQLKSAEVEKSEVETRCTELMENNENLRLEISSAKNLENNPIYGKIQTENGDLKGRILESEKMMAELKGELEVAKESQKKNICKMEELVREIEELKKENSDFSCALTTLEETRKNLADVLSYPGSDCELPTERITKLMEEALPERRERKIVSDFVETVTKTCKGVQNELIKKFDSKKLEWETQKDVDIRCLEDQIKLLNEQNNQREVALMQTKQELTEADGAIVRLKSQLTTAEIEKVEIEVRCKKLEENTQSLQAEIDTKETIIKGLDELKKVGQRMENENGALKEQIMESEGVIIRLKKTLEVVKEESQVEIETLKKEKEGLMGLSEKLENLEKNNKNLRNVIADLQTHLDISEDTIEKILSGNLENMKIFREKINGFVSSQLEGLSLENKNLKLGCDNLKEKVKQLTKLIEEAANEETREEPPNRNTSYSNSMASVKIKSGRKSDLCARRLDKLEEINHNLTELITRMLTMTEFPEPEKLKLYSVRDFPNVMKKVVAHLNGLESKMKEMKEEYAQLDEECETYAEVIKDMKRQATVLWKTNKEKTEALESEIDRLKEEKSQLEKEKEELLGKVSKLDAECQKLKSSRPEGASSACGADTKKINELKRTILVKEQKLLELQDLEAQTSSYKSQIEYLKSALEREKKKAGQEKEKNTKLQKELDEATKNQKSDGKKGEENQILEELRMRGTISGGIVQEFGDKEKMKKLAKDIGILKELCRTRYAEIKRLEAVNAALRNGTPKNSNQMDSPIRSGGYNTRSKKTVRDFWKTELSGKENSAS